MNWKLFFITFCSIFLAELGDKTQLATISFTADNAKFKWIVFIAAALALTLTSFLGVFFGHILTKYIPPKYIKISAGILFLIIGILMLINAFKNKEESTDKFAMAIINEIKRIQLIEKCNTCAKFNNFLITNKDKIPENICISKNTHNPLNCSNCSTDKLNSLI